MRKLDVILTPAEFAPLRERDLSQTACVVFDVLRATTTMVTALGNGADAILPVEQISEALSVKAREQDVLLAGERHGVRIEGALTGGVRFDFGNSPREFIPEKVHGKRIVTTTTNGTRALRACAHAKLILAASFLNMQATAAMLKERDPAELIIVCGGTFEECSYEDVLGAGALCASVGSSSPDRSDAALLAQLAWSHGQSTLADTFATSRNGRRLLEKPDLAADVPYCAQRDIFPLAAEMGKDGWIRKVK